jgi:hypothetical protein
MLFSSRFIFPAMFKTRLLHHLPLLRFEFLLSDPLLSLLLAGCFFVVDRVDGLRIEERLLLLLAELDLIDRLVLFLEPLELEFDSLGMVERELLVLFFTDDFVTDSAEGWVDRFELLLVIFLGVADCGLREL